MIRGNTRVADIYFGEFMRIFDHLYSRYIVGKIKKRGRSDPDAGFLKENAEDWVPQHFKNGPKGAAAALLHGRLTRARRGDAVVRVNPVGSIAPRRPRYARDDLFVQRAHLSPCLLEQRLCRPGARRRRPQEKKIAYPFGRRKIHPSSQCEVARSATPDSAADATLQATDTVLDGGHPARYISQRFECFLQLFHALDHLDRWPSPILPPSALVAAA